MRTRTLLQGERRLRKFPNILIVLAWLVLMPALCLAQADLMAAYEQLRGFALAPQAVPVSNLVLKRDRVEMSFTGEFYLAQPVQGQVLGAVFLGEGRMRVEPWSFFEKDNVQRFLKSDRVEVAFRRAVLRFADDTSSLITAGRGASPGSRADEAQKLAAELEDRMVRETGANLSARLLLALAHREAPGFFLAEFEGGEKGRFAVLLDYQARTPANVFGLDGGEKGMVFQYRGAANGTDIWTTFYSEAEHQQNRVDYSDVFDLVAIPDYRMDIDLREPGDWLRAAAELDLLALNDGVKVVPLNLNEALDEYEQERLKKGVRVLSAKLRDGTPVGVIQHPWEAGLSLVLPRPLKKDEKVTVECQLEGKDTMWSWENSFHYLRSNTTWYPRHGSLQRSRFDLTFHHREKARVVAIGLREREGPSDDNPKEWTTQWKMKDPVHWASFAIGPFERHTEKAKVGGAEVPIEFYSAPGGYTAIKEDFITAELMNGVHYFTALFGDYPYPRMGAVFFPSGFGQGLPSLLFLPVRGYARTHEFAFVSHEIAHQWWGNRVGWRSYRDQWLSEGFAEYSGVLYTEMRDKPKYALDLVKEMRRSLLVPPATDMGIGSGKMYDIGPLVMGHRLSSRKSRGAYSTLIYNKGGLVLRMLHFLFSDPSNGNDKAFWEMMKDFVTRHHNSWATTESFMAVASEHFAKTPIARKYQMNDLGWFLMQWVYRTNVPRYRLEYHFTPGQGGGVVLEGTLFQEGVPDGWFMPLPLVMEYEGNQSARGTIHAFGPATPVKVPLPGRPRAVKLDPELWVLSEETEAKEKR